MFISITADRVVLDSVGQRMANAASTCCRRARPGVHEAWETYRERLLAAGRQAGEALIDEAETASKEAVADLAVALKQAIFPAPQGELPAGL
jgi:hypothetical protein